ncbi:MAG: hypothetical protein K0R63_1532 [Rickettsiales bacterium]|jgi:hypothetical protein|nr:hypothetical protein [Rickettsiales bacterium]
MKNEQGKTYTTVAEVREAVKDRGELAVTLDYTSYQAEFGSQGRALIETEKGNIAELGKFLETSPPLQHLIIKPGKFSRIFAYHLADALKENKTLETLHVAPPYAEGQPGFNYSITDDEAKGLAEALTENKALTKIRFYGENRISILGAEALVKAVKDNSGLQEAKFFSGFSSVTGADSEMIMLNYQLSKMLAERSGVQARAH